MGLMATTCFGEAPRPPELNNFIGTRSSDGQKHCRPRRGVLQTFRPKQKAFSTDGLLLWP